MSNILIVILVDSYLLIVSIGVKAQLITINNSIFSIFSLDKKNKMMYIRLEFLIKLKTVNIVNERCEFFKVSLNKKQI